jgi:hypothetical protein
MLKNQSQELTKTKFKGEFAQLRVQIAAAHKGIIVSLPSTQERYDIILDYNGKLLRGQIKYCDRRHKNNLQLSLSKPNNKFYSKNDIDILLVYVPKVDRILAFHPKDFDKKERLQININDKKSSFYWENFKW